MSKQIKIHNKISLSGIYFIAFLDMLGFGIIIPVLRDFTQLLAKNSHLEWVGIALLSGILMSSYSIAQFFAAPVIGHLSDKYGRRKLLFLSVAGNVVSYLIWAITNDFWIFLASRLISGITGGNVAVAQSYIADITAEKDRGKAMGMMGALFGLGFILGPFIGALLSKIDISHYHFGLISFNQYSLIGLVCAALSGLNLIMISFKLQESNIDRDPNIKINLIKFFPLVRLDSSLLGRLFLIYFLLYFAHVNLEATLMWDLLDRFKLVTAEETGYFFVYMGVMMALVQGGVYRRIHTRFSEFKLCTFGLFTSLIGFFFYTIPSTLYGFAFIIAVISLGLGIAFPVLSALISIKSNKHEQGLNLGIAQSLGSLSRAIAPIAFTALYAYSEAHTLAAALATSLVALAVFFTIKLPKS